MRHTRIIATLGPASDTPAQLDRMLAAGVDIVRLNFSHGSHATHRTAVERLRDAAARANRIVAVLQDLPGPKIRTGPLEGGRPIPLAAGDTLVVATGEATGRPGLVFTPYAPLAQSVRPGQHLLLDDGRVVLRVESSDGERITATVVHGSQLGEHKGINAPGVALPAVGLSARDEEHLAFGLELGVDFIALSFVTRASDIAAARDAIRRRSRDPVPIIAKLERPEAIEHLDEILESADAVMVARGDLGLEMPLERVPAVQKDVTRRARAHGRPVIVATQVLDSMRSEPRPTRAEVSDAANAVEDGVDAIMLTGETAAGAFPVRAVETLDAVIREAETHPLDLVSPTRSRLMHAEHGQAMCEAAVALAEEVRAEAIVAVTREGNTARMLSTLRPRAPILAATERPEIARRLMLFRGVVPIVAPLGGSVDDTGAAVARELRARGLLHGGDEVVFVNVQEDLRRPGANFIKLSRVD
ncbi:MAG TPA: pyruvate kinase [Vicinamibacterales bacterium]